MEKCKVCKKCGGCNINNVEYKDTLVEKTKYVDNLFRKNKKVKVLQTIGMENPYEYRNKGKFAFGMSKEPLLGFYEEGTHKVIDYRNCKIQKNEINEVAEKVLEIAKKYKIAIYNEDTRKGILRHLIVRYGVNTNEIMVVLVTTDVKLSRKNEIVSELLEAFPNIKTIIQNINEKATSAILGVKNIKLYGNGYIIDTLENFKFKISPLSFYQVNSKQTEVLYNKALEFANLTGNEIVYDLYSGIGTISLFATRKARKVYGIEIVTDAVKDAKENARINNIKNVEFYSGKVEIVLPTMRKKGTTPDVIFVDPPRSGLDEKTIRTLLDISAKKIVYISCNPQTLVENIEKLSKKYTLNSVQPVDMFPFTQHVECVCVMTLR